MCGVGLYCSTTCQPTLSLGDACTDGRQCGFGQACHGGVCTQYGTVSVGEVVDMSQDAGDGEYQKPEYLCESYYVETVSSQTMCVWGPEPQFTDYR